MYRTSGRRPEEPGGHQVQMVRLVPGRWTPLPGTGVAVRWDGDREITVRRAGEFWNLAPLVVPGRVLAWVRLAGHPELGDWPVVAIASGSLYRSARRAYRCSHRNGSA
jgi:hypothetical protein